MLFVTKQARTTALPTNDSATSRWLVRPVSYVAGVIGSLRSLFAGSAPERKSARQAKREEKQRRKELIRQSRQTRKMKKAA
jgi:hypothetical protein